MCFGSLHYLIQYSLTHYTMVLVQYPLHDRAGAAPTLYKYDLMFCASHTLHPLIQHSTAIRRLFGACARVRKTFQLTCV